MAKRIPVVFLEPAPTLAVTMGEAARMIGVSRTTLWRLCGVGKIHKTSYGNIPVEELRRHLREEIGQ